MSKIPYLLDEPPIPVYPTLARILGVNKAVMLQQLHFLLNITKTAKNRHNYIDGQWWVYNTYKEWQTDYFGWLSEITIKRLFIELEEEGIVITRQSVKNPSDRTKWYTIDYKYWDKFSREFSKPVPETTEKDEEPIVSKRYDQPSDQNDTIIVSKGDDGYSDTTTDKKSTTTCELPSEDSARGTAKRKVNWRPPQPGIPAPNGSTETDQKVSVIYSPLEKLISDEAKYHKLSQSQIEALNLEVIVWDEATKTRTTYPSPNELYLSNEKFQQFARNKVMHFSHVGADGVGTPKMINILRDYGHSQGWLEYDRDKFSKSASLPEVGNIPTAEPIMGGWLPHKTVGERLQEILQKDKEREEKR